MHLLDGFYRDVPNWQKRFDYGARTDGQPVYRGYALITDIEGDDRWILFYALYNDNGDVIEEYSRIGSWTNRVAVFVNDGI